MAVAWRRYGIISRKEYPRASNVLFHTKYLEKKPGP